MGVWERFRDDVLKRGREEAALMAQANAVAVKAWHSKIMDYWQDTLRAFSMKAMWIEIGNFL